MTTDFLSPRRRTWEITCPSCGCACLLYEGYWVPRDNDTVDFAAFTLLDGTKLPFHEEAVCPSCRSRSVLDALSNREGWRERDLPA